MIVPLPARERYLQIFTDILHNKAQANDLELAIYTKSLNRSGHVHMHVYTPRLAEAVVLLLRADVSRADAIKWIKEERITASCPISSSSAITYSPLDHGQKRTELKTSVFGLDEQPDLDLIVCRRCNSGDVTHDSRVVRRGDEGNVSYFRCHKCPHTWRN